MSHNNNTHSNKNNYNNNKSYSKCISKYPLNYCSVIQTECIFKMHIQDELMCF